MILKWNDLGYATHYIGDLSDVTLVSVWGNHDMPDPMEDAYMQEFGGRLYIKGTPSYVGTSDEPVKRAYVHVMDPDGSYLYRIECLSMYLMNDEGRTIDTLVSA